MKVSELVSEESVVNLRCENRRDVATYASLNAFLTLATSPMA